MLDKATEELVSSKSALPGASYFVLQVRNEGRLLADDGLRVLTDIMVELKMQRPTSFCSRRSINSLASQRSMPLIYEPRQLAYVDGCIQYSNTLTKHIHNLP